MSARRVGVAVVLLLVAGQAAAWVRETTAVGSPASGLCLWWGARQVRFKVNATSAAAPPLRPACPTCAPCQDASAAAALVAATLPAWSGATRTGEAQPCTDLALTSDGTTTSTTLGNDGVNLVVVRTGWCQSTSVVPQNDACRGTVGACAAKYNCWEHDPTGTIGLTTTTFSTATGEILDADVELHGWDGKVPPNGYYLTCDTSPSCTAAPWMTVETGCASTDVASLALHEAGHVLGLDHTCLYPAPYDACTPGSVMQPVIPSGQTRRALDADDVAGMCTIYPRGAATVTCAPPGGAPGGGGCGCAGAEGAQALAFLGVALALRRARRR